jgi:N6-adenosine-specific RNA methylase IME4
VPRSEKRYGAILIDPPWPEHGGGKSKRGADKHYPLLSIKDIPRVINTCPLYEPADNAHLYLWATDNYLKEAFWVMDMIGFRYVRTLPWIKLKNEAFERMDGQTADDCCTDVSVAMLLEWKLKIGIGQYFRGCSELLLFGVRGKGMEVCTDRKDLNNIIIGPRGKHSKKPDSSYEKIEARSKGPYLEIFARSLRPGWDNWGNEIKK